MVNNNNRTPCPVPRPPLLIRSDAAEPSRLRTGIDALATGEVDAGVAHPVKLIKIRQRQRNRGVLDGSPVHIGRCVVELSLDIAGSVLVLTV